MSVDAVCPICKNPKQGDNSGSLTQWIVTCECDQKALRESSQDVTLTICQRCGKRIRPAQQGSISQFIFNSDSCSCTAEELQLHAITAETNSENEPPVNVDEVNAEQLRRVQIELEVLKAAQQQEEASANLISSSLISKLQQPEFDTETDKATNKSQSALRSILLGGTLALAISALVFQTINMTANLFHSNDKPYFETKPALEEEETLSGRMSMYEETKWTINLLNDNQKRYDAGPENTDDDFKLLNEYSDVKSVKVLQSEHITGTGLKHIERMKLGSLALGSHGLTDEGLEYVSRFASLHYLSLGWFGDGVTEAGFAKLAKLQKLTMFEVNHTKLPKNVFDVFTKIPSLTEVQVLVCDSMDHNDLNKLKKLPRLKTIHLCVQNLTDDDCKVLAALPHAREFDLYNNDITDSGVEFLANLPLTLLDLSGNPISDKALLALSKVKTLQQLVIEDCPKVTAAGRRALQKQIPACTIVTTGAHDTKE